MSDKIRKYVIPNIPYLFIFWLCLKLGTAYRLAIGANFGLKIVGIMKTVGSALSTFAPGFVMSDWLIGVAGATLIRLIIYYKVKKQKSLGGMRSTDRPGGERKRI